MSKNRKSTKTERSPNLYERQHFVLYDGWRVGFGGDDFDQHAVDEISVGHLDMKPVAAVLYTCLQYLQREGERILNRGRSPANETAGEREGLCETGS